MLRSNVKVARSQDHATHYKQLKHHKSVTGNSVNFKFDDNFCCRQRSTVNQK